MLNRLDIKTIIVLFMTMMLIAGCGKDNSSSSNKDETTKKLKIVTTFYPMYEFTKNVAKDKADVQLLIPANIEPHDWEPSPKDVANIQNANLFVYNSKFLETWVPSIEKSINRGKLTFVEASKGIDFIEGEDEHHHEMDPHVWLSPVLAGKEVTSITKALIKADPKNKTYYEKNSESYLKQLNQLDHDFRAVTMDAKKKEFITQHAAFGYLAKEYGLKQIPIAGISPSQEPSPARLGELKRFAEEHDVKVIYFGELTSPKVAKTLAAEIGAKTEVLSTLEGLSKEEQEHGLNYITVMQKNLEAIKKSLID